MLILGWLIAGLIAGFLFHGLSDDASRSSCGPPRWSPYRGAWAVTSPACVPAQPGLVGTPAWKQERVDPERRTPPTRKSRSPRLDTGPVRAAIGRDRLPVPAEVWRVTR